MILMNPMALGSSHAGFPQEFLPVGRDSQCFRCEAPYFARKKQSTSATVRVNIFHHIFRLYDLQGDHVGGRRGSVRDPKTPEFSLLIELIQLVDAGIFCSTWESLFEPSS